MTTFPTDAERWAAERSLVWEPLTPSWYRRATRATLDALAPLIADRERAVAARALREAANAIARETVTCEAAAEDWLRDRADELEAGEDRD